MTGTSAAVRVYFGGHLKTLAGMEKVEIPWSPGTVGELLDSLAERFPRLGEEALSGPKDFEEARFLVLVNRIVARRDHPVKPGDEMRIVPPFEGGAQEYASGSDSP